MRPFRNTLDELASCVDRIWVALFDVFLQIFWICAVNTYVAVINLLAMLNVKKRVTFLSATSSFAVDQQDLLKSSQLMKNSGRQWPVYERVVFLRRF